MIGIYEILCRVNGKRYIGSSIFISKRWKDHKYDLISNRHRSSHLQRAWNKHGADAFEFRILELIEGDLGLAEQNWLLYAIPEYNMTFEVTAPMRGRTGSLSHMTGRKMGKEFSAKMSIVTKGRIPWNKGIGGTALAKEKLSRVIDSEHRNKMIRSLQSKPHWTLGKPRSKLTKDRIAASLRGRPGPNLGVRLSQERIEKHRLFMIEFHARKRAAKG